VRAGARERALRRRPALPGDYCACRPRELTTSHRSAAVLGVTYYPRFRRRFMNSDERTAGSDPL
jgi:hypothetical protein